MTLHLRTDPAMARIIPGLSIYSRKDGKVVPRDIALVRSQLDLCRTNATHGNIFFALAHLDEPLVRMLVSGPCAQPAGHGTRDAGTEDPPRPMPPTAAHDLRRLRL